MVMQIGSASVTIEIDEIVEPVEIYIVDDDVIKYDILIGHSFTEKPGIVIIKTANSLAFKRDFSSKSSLKVRNDITIQPEVLTVIPIYADPSHSKHVCVRSSLRGKAGNEYYLMPGEYEIRDGLGELLIQNVSENALELKKSLLITRALPIREHKDIMILKDLESDPVINYGDQLTEDEIAKLQTMLLRHKTCFSHGLKDLGFTSAVQMKIKLTDDNPVVYRPYRFSGSERKIVREMVQDMIEADIVTESSSAYASPILLVKKKQESDDCASITAR